MVREIQTGNEQERVSRSSLKTVRLMGGLGNQMFQYAFGCRLEAESRQPVQFDTTSGFRHDHFGRRFSLGAFKGQIFQVDNTTIPFGVSWPSPWHRLAKLAWGALPGSLQKVTYERRPFNFDPEVLLRPTSAKYYFGYWQNPDYFLSLRQELLQDFSIRQPVSHAIGALMNEMQRQRSISVHVRLYRDRGADGKLIPSARVYHGACPVEYYGEAVKRISPRNGSICYVFSDDPQVAKNELRLPFPCRYVADLVECSDAEQMMLMAACQHHVISNSTFGWWGAWLGQNPEKIVVAPKQWIPEARAVDVQICPKEWIRI